MLLRKRQVKIQFYLSQDEVAVFDAKVHQTGLSRAEYLRTLIAGRTPKPVQPVEFIRLMNEVSALKESVAQLRDLAAFQGQTETAASLDELRREILEEMRSIHQIVYDGGRLQDGK